MHRHIYKCIVNDTSDTSNMLDVSSQEKKHLKMYQTFQGSKFHPATAQL